LDLWDHIIGMTELDVRGMLIMQAMTLGAEWEAFETIVAHGSNTAIPHHQTSKTVIGEWPLLIDMWWRVDGWCSDMTRVLWVKSPKSASPDLTPLPGGTSDWLLTVKYKEFEKVLGIVQQAHQAAIDMVAPWVRFSDIATTARAVIEDAGYGEYFTHSLWHGVWLDVHESPRVSTKSEDIIEPGMVFTIEPGIYLPGKFGVRWEDIVIVEEN